MKPNPPSLPPSLPLSLSLSLSRSLALSLSHYSIMSMFGFNDAALGEESQIAVLKNPSKTHPRFSEIFH